MNEAFVPMVQVECNTMPSRDEHGIPRFFTRCTQQPAIPPGIHPTVPAMPPPPAHLPMFTPHQQPIRAPTVPQMMPQVNTGQYPWSYPGIDMGAKLMFYREESPPSPSISSTVSSLSVYEDCVSLPSSSPKSQQDTFMQGHAPGRESEPHFVPPQQSAATVPPLSKRSRSQTSVHSDGANTGAGHSQTSSIKPEHAMTIVNEKLRNRITDLEKKMHRAMTEVTFLGDRNWRLEAHLDSLMHTLEVLGVTDVEDLTGKTLPLPMFRVKVKAGYRLGPFNRLPRRALWSYEDSLKEPPNIDFSSDRARTIAPEESKDIDDEEDDDGFQLPAGSDIGLSVRQMFHYERQIEELQQQCHALSGEAAGPEAAKELMMADLERCVKKLQEENAELLEDLEDTKAELGRVMRRIQAYEGGSSTHMPVGDDASDHGSESSSMSSSSCSSHPEYGGHPHGAEHHGRDPRRAGPYYRYSYGPDRGERGGHRRRYRDQHPRGRRVASHT